jgi:hypothetical protein
MDSLQNSYESNACMEGHISRSIHMFQDENRWTNFLLKLMRTSCIGDDPTLVIFNFLW